MTKLTTEDLTSIIEIAMEEMEDLKGEEDSEIQLKELRRIVTHARIKLMKLQLREDDAV